MKLLTSLGKILRKATGRNRTPSQEIPSQPQSLPQPQPAQPSQGSAPTVQPTQPAQVIDAWPAVEAALLRRAMGLDPPPPPPEPRPAPAPKPPLVIPTISPIIPAIQWNLPLDVLILIFETYNNVLRDSFNDYANAGIPWILGQICHSWRQAALNSPQLWNFFTLEIDDDNADNDLPEFHQALLSRSGTGPLRVSIDFTRYYDPIPSDTFRIIEPLLERCAQWTTVLIQGLDVLEANRQLGSIRGNLPLLWSLKYYFRGRTQSVLLPHEHGIRQFDLFQDCPALTLVLLNDMNDRLKNFSIVLPWNQITHYGAYNTPDNPFPSEFERQPNLQKLSVVLNQFPEIPTRPVSHQNLRELYLYSTHNVQGGLTQLSKLTLPSLELLVVTFMTMELRQNISIISSVISLVQNSKCSLKKLAIQQNSNLYIDQLPTLFALTPTLETLDIGHGAYFRDALELLRYDPDRTTLLPNLRRLVVAYTSSVKPNDMKLVRELVESREHTSTDPSYAGILNQPLLYVRLHIKRSETRFWCLHDLEGTYVPPEHHGDSNMYPLGLEPSPDWEPEIKKLMIELAELIDSPTRTSPSVTEQIVAKYHQVENMHRCYLIYSGTSLDERYGENKNIRALRKLCRAYIPPEYIRQRKWVMTEPWGLFYLHPEHESRTSTQRVDIVIGVNFPPATGFEGYGYWFSADIDRQLENLRAFIC